jgi:hypothetical protein
MNFKKSKNKYFKNTAILKKIIEIQANPSKKFKKIK